MKQLLPHQKNIIKRMEKLEKTNLIVKDEYILETKMGIYADPNGTGKTYAVLNLIKNDKMDWPIDKIYNKTKTTTKSGGLIKIQTLSKLTRLNTTIIVLSPYLIPNWEEELKTCDLNYIVINSKQDITSDTIFEKDIILVSVNFYNLLISTYPDCIWKRFIFDEPGYCKISNMKFLEAGFYWFICARPNSLSIYHNTCKKSMMRIILGDNWWNLDIGLNDITFKSEPELLKKGFKFADIKVILHDCKCKQLGFESQELKLPGKIINKIDCDKKDLTTDNCSICLSNMKIPTYNHKCSHLFCAACISHWLQLSKNCPLCKTVISPSDLTHIINNEKADNDNKLPSKYELIGNLIKDKTKRNLLWINSDLTLESKYIYKYLSDLKIKYEIFKGNQSIKFSILNKFKSNELDVLILNSKEDIPGLNLQYITDIIFISEILSEYDNVISKVNRIGINHTINVHKFNILV